MNKSEIQISKFLSLVLRHKPETIGIQLDQNGWTDVDILIEKINRYRKCGGDGGGGGDGKFDKDTLMHIVAADSKQRFSFNESFDKIRASQGHFG